ncbi:MAG: sugar-binding protein [Bacteroidales bacterium]
MNAHIGSLLKKIGGLKKSIPHLLFLGTGLASTLWFLLRVIPKPSRASYPCMRAAAPVMSGFVIYLVSLTGSFLFFRTAWRKAKQSRYIAAGAAFIGCIAFVVLFNLGDIRRMYSSPKEISWTRGVLPDGSNNPMGTPLGIYPGRVAWAWNPAATNENCTNVITDGYFMPQNNNQDTIDMLADKTIRAIGGQASVQDSWDAIFKNFNLKKTGTATGYTAGQTIFIKINNGQAGWAINSTTLAETGNDSPVTGVKKAAMSNTTPSAVLAYVRQLVDSCNIPQDKIYIAEPMTHVYKSMYDVIHARYPDVKILDKESKNTSLGRTTSSGWTSNVIKYSDKGNTMPDAVSDGLMNEMYNADYLINFAALKAHARAGVTFGAKLHFGSHGNHPVGGYGSSHLHAGLVSVTDNDKPADAYARTRYKMYRVLTDLMGHEKLGGNTVLFVVDGLWGGIEATDMAVKWQTAPFNNDWPSSLFVSQDGVAIESVCLDFLRAEANVNTNFRDRPFFPGVDDHLHQAADSKNWPAGFTYDPEGDGTAMPSMGIHEHWNNSTKKQYSHNLGRGIGIELVALSSSKLVNNVPVLVGTIGKIRIPGPNASIIAVNDLNQIFTDPDGDQLVFTAISMDAKLTPSIVNGNSLKLVAGSTYTGPSELEVLASDGQDTTRYLLEAYNTATVYAPEALIPPDVDGVPDDAIWEDCGWNLIDQTWIPWGGTVDSSDFNGRYKVCWSSTENLLYFLVEITDDSIVDGYTYPQGNYPDYDIVEVFIDENNSKGKHVFDGTGQTGTDWGTNAENAFSYHIAANQPETGFVTTDFVVLDIAGTSWSSMSNPNYASHFPAYRMYRESAHHYYHEFSLKVYNDTYNPAAPNESSRVNLAGDKILGLSLAYCDNDTSAATGRDNFFGSVYVPEARYNDHWMNALDFGKLILTGNHVPTVVSEFVDEDLTDYNTSKQITTNVKSQFADSDGDSLIFTSSCDSAGLEVLITGNSELSIVAHEPFMGPAIVTITANDGRVSVSTSFEVSFIPSGITKLSEKDAIQVWPNPAGSSLQFKLAGTIPPGSTVISVYSAEGRLVLKENFSRIQPDQAFRLDLKNLRPGNYLLRVQAGQVHAKTGFIKH